MYIVHSAHVLYLLKNVKHFYASVYYLFYIIYIISTLVYIILPLNYPRAESYSDSRKIVTSGSLIFFY